MESGTLQPNSLFSILEWQPYSQRTCHKYSPLIMPWRFIAGLLLSTNRRILSSSTYCQSASVQHVLTLLEEVGDILHVIVHSEAASVVVLTYIELLKAGVSIKERRRCLVQVGAHWKSDMSAYILQFSRLLSAIYSTEVGPEEKEEAIKRTFHVFSRNVKPSGATVMQFISAPRLSRQGYRFLP